MSGVNTSLEGLVVFYGFLLGLGLENIIGLVTQWCMITSSKEWEWEQDILLVARSCRERRHIIFWEDSLDQNKT